MQPSIALYVKNELTFSTSDDRPTESKYRFLRNYKFKCTSKITNSLIVVVKHTAQNTLRRFFLFYILHIPIKPTPAGSVLNGFSSHFSSCWIPLNQQQNGQLNKLSHLHHHTAKHKTAGDSIKRKPLTFLLPALLQPTATRNWEFQMPERNDIHATTHLAQFH